MESVKTKKGTTLPLINLKGKSYLMVAYRLQWLSEDYENYTIDTEFPLLTADETIARATVVIYDANGKVVRKAQATKRETKKDFPDHTEKAETAAIGRALSMLGLGTQHAIADLDEGTRLADSPLVNTKNPNGVVEPKDVKPSQVSQTTASTPNTAITAPSTLPPGAVQAAEVPKKRPSFRRETKNTVTDAAVGVSTAPAATNNGLGF